MNPTHAREYILWGLPKGEHDHLHAAILYTQGRTPADVERVRRLAERDGWHSFRVQVIDLSREWDAGEAFAKAVKRSD